MKRIILYTLVVLLSPASVMAQDEAPYREHVYLHTDQETYLTGEYIWFSAYLTDSRRSFSSLSKVLYVEVLNAGNSPVLQAKVMMNEGRGNGSLFIPASLESGSYTLRAYTQWMRNSSPDYFFHSTLRIINPFVPLSPTQKENPAGTIKVTFHPEGGTWLKGVPGTMGFQVTGPDGRGIPFRGMVTDAAGDTVALFYPERFGRGKFSLTPENGPYNAVIKNVYDSVIVRTSLPPAVSGGRSLLVQPERSGYSVEVACTSCTEYAKISLWITGPDGSSTSKEVALEGGAGKTSLLSSELPAGVSWLTLRDETGQTIAARAVFRNPETRTAVLSTGASEYSVRQQISYQIEAPAGSSLSLSVYRQDDLYRQNTVSPASEMYLAQAIEMPLEDPVFLAAEGSENAMDDLMRMLPWKDADRDITFLPEKRGQLITAHLKSKDSAKRENIPVYMSLPGKPFVLRVGLTDSTGTVLFQAGDVYGKRTLILQPVNQADSSLVFEPESPFEERVASRITTPFFLEAETREAIEARSLGMQMNNIYHGEERARLQTNVGDTLPFFGIPTHRYLLDDYTRFPSMLDVLKEYVYTVAARRRNKSYVLRVLDEKNNIHFEAPPLTLLDGVPVVNHDKLLQYDPLKVEKIDVIAGKYVFGPMAFPGIVSFSTYNNTLEDFTVSPSVVQVDYDGVQFTREFYVPDFSLPVNKRRPDMRSLLLWEPNLETGPSGTSEGVIHTSDRPGTYIMIVEGLTPDGIPVFGKHIFEVKPDLRTRK